ncbi:hypothetical protein BC827DRAFT_1204048 [Russula dissimulans]|nr:hypothetical protein BC827DRAFT_1204048 [Russula dissimulans]
MSYLEGSNRSMTGREDVLSRHSFLSDGSVLEDLLAKLEDFPCVPGDISLHAAAVFPSSIYEAENRFSDKTSPSITPLVIDTSLGNTFQALSSDEVGDPSDAFLHTSQTLHAHSGLVMEHVDLTTSIHTFKNAYPQDQLDESPQLSCPATPSLSNGSSSSPHTPSMQAPSSGPFSRSASSLLREPPDSRVISGGLHRVAHSMSSSASGSLNSVLQHHPPLQFSPSLRSRDTSRRLDQGVPSSNPSMSSFPSSGTYFSAAERLARRPARHVAGASPGPGDASSSSVASDSPRSPRDELLAFREFLARRAADVRTEALVPEYRDHPYGPGSIRGDSSDFSSEYEDSISSGRSQFHYNLPDRTVASTGLDSLDRRSTKGDLLRVLSIVRAERERVSSDDGSLLGSTDTFLDLYARSSSSVSHLQRVSPTFRNSDASNPLYRVSPRSQLINPPSPVATASTSLEGTQDFLPDFLDLHPDVDPGLVSDDLSSSNSGDLHCVHDESLAPVPEDSAPGPSREWNTMRVEGERAGLVPGKPRSIALRRAQSAADLVSGQPQHGHRLPPNQGYSRPRNTHGDLQPNDPEAGRAYPTPVPATVAAEVTKGHDSRHPYGRANGTLVDFAELTYSQSMVEPDNLPRGDSYYTKPPVQGQRIRDGRHPNPGLRIAVDPSSARESLSRKTGPAFQRPRAMTLQDITASGSPSPDRLHRSASANASAPSASFSPRGRLRTLSDRAYRHPDVPYSPLFSEMDHAPLPQSTSRPGPSSWKHSNGRDRGNTSLGHPRGLAPGDAYSRSTSSMPPKSRPQVPLRHGRKDSYPMRERPVPTVVRRSGSSPDLGRTSIVTVLPTPAQGVGLSLVDNGAFEAPRRAPEPRTHTQDKTSVPSRAATPRGALSLGLKKPVDDDAMRDSSYLAVDTSPTGFSALSFRRSVWSKKQKQPPRSDSSAGNSESSDLKSSFMSIVDQRKGFLFKKKL